MIPHFSDLDDLTNFLTYLEDKTTDLQSCPLSPLQASKMSTQQQLLSLTLAKPSIEWLLNNPPQTQVDDLLSLDLSVTEGLDSQITLFNAVIPEVKRLTHALNSVNDYQRTL